MSPIAWPCGRSLANGGIRTVSGGVTELAQNFCKNRFSFFEVQNKSTYIFCEPPALIIA